MVIEAGAWYTEHPSKSINKQRNKLIKLVNSPVETLTNKGLAND
jgi:hypothetical protein